MRGCSESRVTERESPRAASDPESLPVGEGPLYATMRAEAKKLIPVWIPWGIENSQRSWGAGICSVKREDDDTNTVSVLTLGREVRPAAVLWPASIKELRASAISLLVYCEAYDGDDA